MTAGGIDDVGAHEEVVEVQVGGPGHVGPDATHPGGEVHDDVRVVFGEEPVHLIGGAQVALGARWGDHTRPETVSHTPSGEAFEHCPTQEP